MSLELRCPNPACQAAIPAGATRCAACGQVLVPLPPTAPGALPYAIATGARPGGLTAMAVINFIFAALGCFGMVAILGGSAVLDSSLMTDPQVTSQMTDAEKADLEKTRAALREPVVKVLGGVEGVVAILLVVSGIGYLRMRKTLGRMVGNIYAILALGSVAAGYMLVPADVSGGINLWTFLELIYPVLTLFLVNVTFKNDLVS